MKSVNHQEKSDQQKWYSTRVRSLLLLLDLSLHIIRSDGYKIYKFFSKKEKEEKEKHSL